MSFASVFSKSLFRIQTIKTAASLFLRNAGIRKKIPPFHGQLIDDLSHYSEIKGGFFVKLKFLVFNNSFKGKSKKLEIVFMEASWYLFLFFFTTNIY